MQYVYKFTQKADNYIELFSIMLINISTGHIQ